MPGSSTVTRPLSARVSIRAHDALRHLAAERGSTVSSEVARLLDAAVLREQQAAASKLERV